MKPLLYRKRAAVALFARAPVAGQVKTRLIPLLGPEEACALHRALARDAWEVLLALGPACEAFLYSDQDHPDWRDLAGDRLRLQRGRDLGERMLACFEEMAAQGLEPLLIVGSDTVGLTPEALAPWTRLLEEAPVVLGPAEDGGYWAIGCQRPDPRMFEGVEWSAGSTLDATRAALNRCGMPLALLAPLWDLDRPDDLARLRANPPPGRLVRGWLDLQRG